MKAITRTALSVALLIVVTIPQAQAPQPSATGSIDLSRSLVTKARTWGPARKADVPELRLPASALIGTATVYAETERQIEMAKSAIDRFEAAGLDLPPVTIHMHTSRARCSDYPEYIRDAYYVQIDGEHVIHSCADSRTLLHEFGHAWESIEFDSAVRNQILEMQGLDSWRHDTWNQAGAEHLADIIAWGIEGTHPTRIGNYSQDHLAELYVVATGNQPPVLTDAVDQTPPGT